ncbi:hypothetical protein KEM48_012625 [Puccinia striiformis f. sp. tritici PST-130]|nr:hypothetical protein KEM48_012625 [Puccinia striiformis f. sp. tritici PST-130]
MGSNEWLGYLNYQSYSGIASSNIRLKSISKFQAFSAGLVIGGKSLEDERDRLGRANVLVSTPGRLQQHLKHTTKFDFDNLQVLALDEAD